MLTIVTSFRVYGITLFFLLLVSFSAILHANDSPPASEGTLDLSNWDFIAAGNVDLKGEWAFYWDKLIPPEAFLNSDTSSPKMMSLPQNWNDFEIAGKRLGPEGFATFRLLIKLKKPYSPLALKIPNIDSAYKLWINSRLIAEVGQVGETAQDSVPQLLPLVTGFANDSKTLDIVIQVSNFGYTKGGIWSIPLLGLQKDIYEERENQNMISLFLVGSFVIMCFYHLGLYLLRSKETITLVFCLICLSLSFRTLVGGEALFFHWFSLIPWEVGIKLAYTTFILPPGLIILFYYFLYPQDISKKIIFGILAIIFFILVLLLLLSPLQIGVLLLLFEIILLVFMGCSAFFFTRVVRRKRQGAIVMLLSLIVLIGTGVNDILNDISVINTGYYGPFGIFTLIFSQSWILAIKFTKAFNDVENLTEQLLKTEKTKDEFLANTSHELRTPIHGIIGIADSLVNGIAGDLSRIAKENLQLIIHSGKRLSNLVNDILDFSQLKNKNLQIKKEPVSIKQIIDIVIQVCQPLAGKNIVLNNYISKEIPFVIGDEDRLQQIVFNLVGNAIKFTKEGQINVFAEVSKNRVVVTISDTGGGIPSEKLSTIFDEFEQVDSSASRQYNGTGIGLSITKKLIELHDGMISVTSTVGQGSKFTFFLPIAEGSTKTKEINVSAGEITALQFEPTPKTPMIEQKSDLKPGVDIFKVLVVDDDAINRVVISNHLSLYNYEVHHASSGREALQMIENGPIPHIILLDLMMPDMTGFEVTQKIRALHSLDSLPIIIVTAANRVKDFVHAVQSGANDYITKPFSNEELITRIRLHRQLFQINQALKDHQENLEFQVKARTCEIREFANEAKKNRDIAVAASQAKSVFLANISHELRTPMHGLLGFANLGKSKSKMKNFKDLYRYFCEIVASGERLLLLLNDLLDLSKHAAEKFDYDFKAGKLMDVVQNVVNEFTVLISKKEINFNYGLKPNTDCVYIDDQRIGQVVRNILSNAIKFSNPKGTVTIDIYNENDSLIFAMIDSGIGIPENELKVIFDEFVQSSKSMTDAGGTGLGLSICSKFVQAHNGEIWAETNPTGGSIIKFSLPLYNGNIMK